MKTMTKKQRIFILGFFALLVASYFIRAIGVAAVRAMDGMHHTSRPKPAPKPRPVPTVAKDTAQPSATPVTPVAAIPAPAAPALPAPPSATPVQGKPAEVAAAITPPVAPPVLVPPSLLKSQGIWRGTMAVEGRGVCNLRIEIKRHPNAADPFSGYFTVNCTPMQQLGVNARASQKTLTIDKMDPEAAIMLGAIDNESIVFRLDKTVVADSGGCSPSGLIITPFGNNLFAAEWKDGFCAGGHLILRKANA